MDLGPPPIAADACPCEITKLSRVEGIGTQEVLFHFLVRLLKSGVPCILGILLVKEVMIISTSGTWAIAKLV
jgi:hypothetical protein